MTRLVALAFVIGLAAQHASADIMSFSLSVSSATTDTKTITGASVGGEQLNVGGGTVTVTTFTTGATSGQIGFTTAGLPGTAAFTLSAFNMGGESLTAFALNSGSLTTPLNDPGLPNLTPTITFGTAADTTVVFDFTTTGGGGAAVPEPSSFAALALCGIGFVAARRRRKKA